VEQRRGDGGGGEVGGERAISYDKVHCEIFEATLVLSSYACYFALHELVYLQDSYA
jgi:hypothetical protein